MKQPITLGCFFIVAQCVGVDEIVSIRYSNSKKLEEKQMG
jgi:hypothetical protein